MIALKQAAQDLLDQIQSLENYTLSRDLEPHKAQACWDDAIRATKAALAASTPVGGWEDISTWTPKAAAHWPYLEALIVVDGKVMAADWQPGAKPPKSGKWWPANLDSEYGSQVFPTHWMPLPPPPSVSTGSRPQEAVPGEQAEPAVVDDRLHDAIRQLRQHMTTIQAAKIASAAGHPQGMGPIWNLVNALPAIVRQLDAAELDIEAAFERYEDARPQPADGYSSNEGAAIWITHDGGPNPVGHTDIVEARRRDGSFVTKAAFKFDWSHDQNRVGILNDRASDIIAYRILTQTEKGS
jgi:hypothetical protein